MPPSIPDNIRTALISAAGLTAETAKTLSTPDLERRVLGPAVGKSTPDLRREQNKSQQRLYKGLD